ncbi:MAG: hypothetical protein GF411_03035 [Candidatus Lokiarchaeota archaeon]|nr:hypothetical protein [Candidatus Lokiarchaeota archaeon]
MNINIFSTFESVNYQWMKDADSYANERSGKWGWYGSIRDVSYSLPFHRTLMGVDHTYFILDLDPELITYEEDPSYLKKYEPTRYREILIRGMIEIVHEFLEDIKPHEFFAKLSGTGIHLIQRVDERIDKRRFKTVIREICKPCSQHLVEDHVCNEHCDGWNFSQQYNRTQHKWIKNKDQWSRYFTTSTGTVIQVNIDLSIFSSRRHLIRWTYSINKKIPQMPNYSIPIDFWDADWVLEHMTLRGLTKHPPHYYEIPSFSFDHALMDEETLHSSSPKQKDSSYYRQDRDLSYHIEVPDVDAELTQDQLRKIKDMKDVLTGDIAETAPCIVEHYNRSTTLAAQFWPRVVLVRYLSSKGYSPSDIALFIRFHINDDDDNLPHNQEKLFTGVKEAYGSLDDPDMVPGCKKMREHEFFGVINDPNLCELCGRRYPTSTHRDLQGVKEEKDDGFNEIMRLARNILLGGESSVIKKTTRAGVTTSIIAMAKLVGKRLLVVTPTNRIGETTIPNALKIAKETLGIDIRGAMFAANKKACLKLVLIDKTLRHRRKVEPNWGNNPDKLAYDHLHYQTRPRCEDCIFSQEYFDTLRYHENDPSSFPVPILHSEVYNWFPSKDEKDIDGKCAYTTIKAWLSEIDVMFTTYSKLNALMVNDTEDAQMLSDAIAKHFDVILLDEVSYLTNQSPLIVPIIQKRAHFRPHTSIKKYSIDIFEDIENETDRMSTILPTSTTTTAVRILSDFKRSQIHLRQQPPVDRYTKIKINKPGSIIDKSDYDEIQTKFTAFHGLIEHAAKEHNIHLEKSEDLFHLLHTPRWIEVSLPTKFHPIDVSLIAEPDVSLLRRFIRHFHDDRRQVLVTDATLPYVDISKFLGIDLVDQMVGDPRGTNDHQLVVADSRRISVLDLFFGGNAQRYQEELEDYINMICKEHGADNVIIVTPNKWTYYNIYNRMVDGKIPTCDMTWYRSDRTVGVECDKRVMICITSPHPPHGAHDWLAAWYHEQGLLREEEVEELGKHLSNNSAKASFYQTIGRAKDPACKDRSVVYAFGIKGSRDLIDSTNLGVGDLMMFEPDISIPHITMTSREFAHTDIIPKIGRAWIDARIKLNIIELRLFSKVYEYGSFNTTQTKKLLAIYSREEIEEAIAKRIQESGHAVFKQFDIEIEPVFNPPNGPWSYKLRRINDGPISS